MNFQDDKDNEIRRRERELQERENALRLRELEAEINRIAPPLYQTSRHESSSSQKLWKKKLVNAGKFFALVVATIVSVKVASWLTGVILIGGIAWFAYLLFFKSDRSNY